MAVADLIVLEQMRQQFIQSVKGNASVADQVLDDWLVHHPGQLSVGMVVAGHTVIDAAADVAAASSAMMMPHDPQHTIGGDAARWIEGCAQQADQALAQIRDEHPGDMLTGAGSTAGQIFIDVSTAFADPLKFGEGIKSGTAGGLLADGFRLAAMTPFGDATQEINALANRQAAGQIIERFGQGAQGVSAGGWCTQAAAIGHMLSGGEGFITFQQAIAKLPEKLAEAIKAGQGINFNETWQQAKALGLQVSRMKALPWKDGEAAWDAIGKYALHQPIGKVTMISVELANRNFHVIGAFVDKLGKLKFYDVHGVFDSVEEMGRLVPVLKGAMPSRWVFAMKARPLPISAPAFGISALSVTGVKVMPIVANPGAALDELRQHYLSWQSPATGSPGTGSPVAGVAGPGLGTGAAGGQPHRYQGYVSQDRAAESHDGARLVPSGGAAASPAGPSAAGRPAATPVPPPVADDGPGPLQTPHGGSDPAGEGPATGGQAADGSAADDQAEDSQAAAGPTEAGPAGTGPTEDGQAQPDPVTGGTSGSDPSAGDGTSGPGLVQSADGTTITQNVSSRIITPSTPVALTASQPAGSLGDVTSDDTGPTVSQNVAAQIIPATPEVGLAAAQPAGALAGTPASQDTDAATPDTTPNPTPPDDAPAPDGIASLNESASLNDTGTPPDAAESVVGQILTPAAAQEVTGQVLGSPPAELAAGQPMGSLGDQPAIEDDGPAPDTSELVSGTVLTPDATQQVTGQVLGSPPAELAAGQPAGSLGDQPGSDSGGSVPGAAESVSGQILPPDASREVPGEVLPDAPGEVLPDATEEVSGQVVQQPPSTGLPAGQPMGSLGDQPGDGDQPGGSEDAQDGPAASESVPGQALPPNATQDVSGQVTGPGQQGLPAAQPLGSLGNVTPVDADEDDDSDGPGAAGSIFGQVLPADPAFTPGTTSWLNPGQENSPLFGDGSDGQTGESGTGTGTGTGTGSKPVAEAPTAEAPTAEAPTAEAPTAEAQTAGGSALPDDPAGVLTDPAGGAQVTAQGGGQAQDGAGSGSVMIDDHAGVITPDSLPQPDGSFTSGTLNWLNSGQEGNPLFGQDDSPGQDSPPGQYVMPIETAMALTGTPYGDDAADAQSAVEQSADAAGEGYTDLAQSGLAQAQDLAGTAGETAQAAQEAAAADGSAAASASASASGSASADGSGPSGAGAAAAPGINYGDQGAASDPGFSLPLSSAIDLTAGISYQAASSADALGTSADLIDASYVVEDPPAAQEFSADWTNQPAGLDGWTDGGAGGDGGAGSYDDGGVGTDGTDGTDETDGTGGGDGSDGGYGSDSSDGGGLDDGGSYDSGGGYDDGGSYDGGYDSGGYDSGSYDGGGYDGGSEAPVEAPAEAPVEAPADPSE
ncbi:MAG TPA: hypothetical protein VGG25_10560 [Streptosporangiaceae bacterium]